MDLVAEFRRHADASRRAARETKDSMARAHWELLAERWQRRDCRKRDNGSREC
jgi:hypothetical protein